MKIYNTTVRNLLVCVSIPNCVLFSFWVSEAAVYHQQPNEFYMIAFIIFLLTAWFAGAISDEIRKYGKHEW